MWTATIGPNYPSAPGRRQDESHICRASHTHTHAISRLPAYLSFSTTWYPSSVASSLN